MAEVPTVRWAIIDAVVKHVIQAIRSSLKAEEAKGEAFAAKHCPNSKPTIYNSYEAACGDSEVDIVYIGTPHFFHRQNCLDAIAHSKNVLCKKAFALNAREARDMFTAAKEKGALKKLLYEDKVICDVFRMSSDFGRKFDVPNLPAASRFRDTALSAGTLLELGIYSLTWGLMALDPKIPRNSESPRVLLAAQTFEVGVEVSTSIILTSP
ncbi:hypothetical protein F4823DRAFT_569298 [Ustulina deusta]|nr:hypothetical protein F4823DRAFT_569298 [Ustulina deusta]